MSASKQSVAQQEQGYRKGAHNCGNCKHRTCEFELPLWMKNYNQRNTRDHYKLERDGIEKAQKCGLGGFAIQKTATCDRWEPA